MDIVGYEVFLVVVPALVGNHILDKAWVDIVHELQPIFINLFWLVKFGILEISGITRLFDCILELVLDFLI